ncbi:odorant receptor 22c-like [Anopheles aquasalis]|uniref:odorant receptor 22c-like n=1 Tax=Anopheles aquasalis TaxID=42839 RepID=UPI00215B44A8|nr:odorant receptor 22c-like [Anopheles aquasalis]
MFKRTVTMKVEPPSSEPVQSGFFRLQHKILLAFGIWPLDRANRRWFVSLQIGVNLIALTLCMICEFLYGLYAYQDGDLSEAIESISPTVARLSGLLRMVFYLINEKHLEKVLKCIEVAQQHEPLYERNNTQRIARLGQRVTFYHFLMMFIAALLYGVTPFLIMGYNWYQGQWPLVKILPFKLALPYDSQRLFPFILTTLFLNYASIPTITSQSGSDALLIGVCLYVRGQFDALGQDIAALGGQQSVVGVSRQETHHINRQLQRINQRHQRIIEITGEVRAAFALNIFLIYMCGALILCIVSIAMLTVEGVYKFTYLPFAFSELAILFLYSYSGSIICDSSEAIQTAAYSFPWYRYDRDTRHLIQLLMIRAQRGSNLNVPFFETSMATFSVIVRSASSYVTLMKSFL